MYWGVKIPIILCEKLALNPLGSSIGDFLMLIIDNVSLFYA